MGKKEIILLVLYKIGSLTTFIYLLFFNDVSFNWWNWIIIIPISGFLSGIWPLYWAILRPLDIYVFSL